MAGKPLLLTNKVLELLKKHPDKRYTSREIALWIFKTYPEECEAKIARATAKKKINIIEQLVAEIGVSKAQLQKKYPNIIILEDRPRKFYYTEKTIDDEIETDEIKSPNTSVSEHDLYPLIIEYLKSEHNLYSKRIDEKTSKNNRGINGNKWLHPDIVALENLTHEFDRNVIEFLKKSNTMGIRLWSFEVKLKINVSNVRQAFFQAISNSSWANIEYLISAEIEKKALQELSILSSLHGIGYIQLNIENPSESQIILPAKEDNLDWASINRLVKVNPDFKKYITEVKNFLLTTSINSRDWD